MAATTLEVRGVGSLVTRVSPAVPVVAQDIPEERIRFAASASSATVEMRGR